MAGAAAVTAQLVMAEMVVPAAVQERLTLSAKELLVKDTTAAANLHLQAAHCMRRAAVARERQA